MERNLIMNHNKRIAMFSIHSDPLAAIGSHGSGGQNVYVCDLALALDKKGWEIDIFTRQDDCKKELITHIGSHSRVIRIEAGKPEYIYKGNLHALFPEIFKKFKEFIESSENGYSLFHGHHYDGGWIGVRAMEEFNKPLVENFHSLGKVRQQTQKQYLSKTNDIQAFNERFAIEEDIVRKSSAIISLAETEKEDLVNLYGANPRNISVIPGGVDLRQFNPDKDKAISRKKLNFSEKDYILLFVGRLEWRKGIGTLISALNLLNKKIKNVKVIIVGGEIFGNNKNREDVGEYERLMSKAEDEKVANLVQFVGRVDHENISDYYAASDAFIIPSYYEPFGLVALEALAMKTPVIASRKDGLKITISDRETGLLFEPRSPEDLYKKVVEIYENPSFAAQMAEKGRKMVEEKYSWNNIADQISEIYNNLLKK